ncbi:MAG TPA: response regulator [Bryobacteraceae bacterium]|nr:response regulator [Bryobacteraceae bacterium]
MSRLILIVEDSEPCAETLQIALESIPGVETRVSRSPTAALATALADGIDVAAVVTDLHLAQYDGLDLIRSFRKQPRFADLPIILISGDSDPRLPARALAEGANAFFSKPYSPSAVRRKLEQLI